MFLLKFILTVICGTFIITYAREKADFFNDRFDAGYWAGLFVALVIIALK